MRPRHQARSSSALKAPPAPSLARLRGRSCWVPQMCRPGSPGSGGSKWLHCCFSTPAVTCWLAPAGQCSGSASPETMPRRAPASPEPHPGAQFLSPLCVGHTKHLRRSSQPRGVGTRRAWPAGAAVAGLGRACRRQAHEPAPLPPYLHICHCWVAVQKLLYLPRIHILAATDHLHGARRGSHRQRSGAMQSAELGRRWLGLHAAARAALPAPQTKQQAAAAAAGSSGSGRAAVAGAVACIHDLAAAGSRRQRLAMSLMRPTMEQ